MKPEATKLATTANVQSALQIAVSDIEALYEAVDNPSNAGKTIVLKPTTTPYVLSRHRGTQERLNKGRLELQQDMSLTGSGDPAKCVLEALATDLPKFDEIPNARSGMIRAGRGKNTIAKLTLNVPSEAGSGICTDLNGSQETTVRIERVNSGDPDLHHLTRGVDIRNTGTAVIGRRLTAVIENCQFYGGRQGIRIANFQGAHDCQISVEMKGNSSRQNFAGCFITNHTSNSGVIKVSSHNDQFTSNGVGCAVIGAIQSGTSNRASFTAHKLVTEQNNGAVDLQTGYAGGIVVRGADKSTNTTNATLDKNQVEIALKDCSFDSNEPAGDVLAHGAFSTGSTVAGTNNTVTISVRGQNNFTIAATPSQPPESGSQTNKVIVTS